MKSQVIVFLFLVAEAWTLRSDISLTNAFSGFLPHSQDGQKLNMRILDTNNDFNVDDFSNASSDLESDAYIPIMTLNYYGSWNSSTNIINFQQFGFFNNSFGSVDFTASANYTQGIDNNLEFKFYDGQYKNEKAVVVNFIYDNATDFNPATSTFQNDSISFMMYAYDDSDLDSQTTCQGSYQLTFVDSATNAPYQKTSNDYESVYALFWLNSTNCNISVFSSISTENSIKASKAMNYAIMLVVICAIQLYACIKMSRAIIMNESRGTKISLISLGLLSGWDVFLCLFHLYNALIVDDFFPSFVIPSFCYFILVSIFETRLILLVWKAKYYNELMAAGTLRRGLLVFYLKFYGFLSLFLLACYFLVPATWLFYVTGLFFIPQIVHSAMKGQRFQFNATYVFCLGFVRIALPLYVKVCPVNIFKLAPETSFAYGYGSLILAQILVIFLQSKLGPRFFVPAAFLPKKYDYYRNVSVGTGLSDEEESCSICMDSLNQSTSNVKTGLLLGSKGKFKIMETPCRHQFHEVCLKDWMDIKLECPFCRSKLPPLE